MVDVISKLLIDDTMAKDRPKFPVQCQNSQLWNPLCSISKEHQGSRAERAEAGDFTSQPSLALECRGRGLLGLGVKTTTTEVRP